MLHWLFASGADSFGLFNLLNYITFRAAGAIITAFVLSLLLGPRVLAILKRHGVRERTEKTPAEVLRRVASKKSGTPTMGGILLCSTLLLSALLWCRFDNNPYTALGLGLVIFYCAVGWLDDLIKIRERYRGLKALIKLVLMTAGAMGIGIVLYQYAMEDQKLSHLSLVLPFVKDMRIDLTGFFAIPWLLWCWLLISGSGNAVNITDGLDGLATGLAMFVALTLALVCYLVGRLDYSGYLFIPHVVGMGEMAVLLGALAGSCMGFLWYNCSPAMIFMGDTGSLPLGGLLGFAAIVSRQEFILLIGGGLFVVDTLSVILQVGSFKLRGKRIFQIAPIHHVPQIHKVPENRIVMRFWILGAMLCMMALATLKIR